VTEQTLEPSGAAAPEHPLTAEEPPIVVLGDLSPPVKKRKRSRRRPPSETRASNAVTAAEPQQQQEDSSPASGQARKESPFAKYGRPRQARAGSDESLSPSDSAEVCSSDASSPSFGDDLSDGFLSSDEEGVGALERSWMASPSPMRPDVQSQIDATPTRVDADGDVSLPQQQQQQQQKQQQTNPAALPKDHKPFSRKRPVIFFGTRTHTQVKQLVHELGKTPYRPRM
jgi:hypothetical protein